MKNKDLNNRIVFRLRQYKYAARSVFKWWCAFHECKRDFRKTDNRQQHTPWKSNDTSNSRRLWNTQRDNEVSSFIFFVKSLAYNVWVNECECVFNKYLILSVFFGRYNFAVKFFFSSVGSFHVRYCCWMLSFYFRHEQTQTAIIFLVLFFFTM